MPVHTVSCLLRFRILFGPWIRIKVLDPDMGSGFGFGIWIRVRDQDKDSGSWSCYRRIIWPFIKRNFLFWKAGSFFLRAGDFFLNLEVLHKGLWRNYKIFWPKNFIFRVAFWGHQKYGYVSRSGSREKPWSGSATLKLKWKLHSLKFYSAVQFVGICADLRQIIDHLKHYARYCFLD